MEFAQAAKNAPDGIPFIIKKCTSEIESRALNVKVCLSLFIKLKCEHTFLNKKRLSRKCYTAGFCLYFKLALAFQITIELCYSFFFFQGIYRVNGAKSRVEKLCQAFENGKDLVELSELYAHDISNVLKLYLRQVCT